MSREGLVTSLGHAGQVRILAQYDKVFDSAFVTITQVPTALRLVPAAMTLASGRTALASVSVLDAAGDEIPGMPITLSSGDPALITVSGPAITSVGPLGSTSVHAAAAGLSADLSVTVVAVSHPLGNIAGSTPPLPRGLYAVAVAPSGIVLAGSQIGDLYRSDITSFDTSTVRISPGEKYFGVAFSSSGDRAFVTGLPDDGIGVFDGLTGALLDSTGGLQGTPYDVKVSPDDHSVYVSTADHLYALDASSLSITGEMTTAATGIHVTLDPARMRLYVSDQANRVLAVDALTLFPLRVFSGLGVAQATGLSPDGSLLYVADERGYLHTVDLATGATVATTTLVCNPWGLAVAQDGAAVCELTGARAAASHSTRGPPRRTSSRFEGGVLPPEGCRVAPMRRAGRLYLQAVSGPCVEVAMPTYEYLCPAGHVFEKFQKMTDSPKARCPECGKQATRQISGGAGLVFKGSGFYITDYGKDGKGPRKADKPEKPGTSETAKPEKKTESKAESSKPSKKAAE